MGWEGDAGAVDGESRHASTESGFSAVGGARDREEVCMITNPTELTVQQELCAQCKSNADWNDAGGYHELAQRCRDYCRSDHREVETSRENRGK